MSDRAGTVLDALLARSAGRGPRVLAARALQKVDRFHCPAAEFLSDRDLAKALAAGDVGVVAVERATPTVLRAIRRDPCPLLVVVGKARDGLDELPEQTWLLGPSAQLRTGSGKTLACAADGAELDPLVTALGGSGLALCPTPAWLPALLEHGRLEGWNAVGYVDAGALTPDWARWSAQTSMPHVITPLGIEPARVEVPRDPGLGPAVAAHTLERFTGPLFPAPRVLALVAGPEESADRRGQPDAEAGPEPSAQARALWAQARRALPEMGVRLGMQVPPADLPLDIPTASFLAQGGLLRRRERMQLLREPLDPPPSPAQDGVDRAHEVLRSAGEVLSDHESKVVLRGFGVEITRQAVASSASGAAQFAERIGFPVVLKAVSPDLRRKREVGGVVLGLQTAAAVRRAYASILTNVEDRAPTARIDGVLVAEMIGPGLDVRCGAVRLRDGEVAFHGAVASDRPTVEPRLAMGPLDLEDAVLLAHAILSQVPLPALRRTTDPDVRVLARLFVHLDALVRSTGDRILAVDLNPVRLLQGERDYATLDASIVQRAHLDGT